MNREELLELHEQMCNKGREIMRAKNQDYTAAKDAGGDGDAFANFKCSLILGIEPEIGLMNRMLDKLKRGEAYVRNGELAVESEGPEDLCLDLLNYAVLLRGLFQERAAAHKPVELPKWNKVNRTYMPNTSGTIIGIETTTEVDVLHRELYPDLYPYPEPVSYAATRGEDCVD